MPICEWVNVCSSNTKLENDLTLSQSLNVPDEIRRTVMGGRGLCCCRM